MTGTGIDKSEHYGRYQAGEDWRQSLAKKMTHKALDIPEDDMNINANRVGLGTLGAIGVAAVGGIPAAIIAALYMLKTPAVPAPLQPTAAAAKTVVDKLRLHARWKTDGSGQWTPVPEIVPQDQPTK